MAQSKIVELVDLNRKLEKHQVIYIARKYDRIDENLSRFINRYPERDRMKIMFLRESEGVYQFGSKRVYIKIEQGNQILVRVGGGYMFIKDFIEQYTPAEVEKIRRKDVIGRFASKTLMQKAAHDQAIRSLETTPIAAGMRAKTTRSITPH